MKQGVLVISILLCVVVIFYVTCLPGNSDVLVLHNPEGVGGDQASGAKVGAETVKHDKIIVRSQTEHRATEISGSDIHKEPSVRRPSDDHSITTAVVGTTDTTIHKHNNSLSQNVIDGVKKFVIFIGYPRSGHSIVGSFMDAHPHMVIAHEFGLFEKLASCVKMNKSCLKTKSSLFNALYRASYEDSRTGWRSDFMNSKKYTLSVDSPWLGTYDRYISVIGDKRGGGTTRFYHERPEDFKVIYKKLQMLVDVPIKAIHCARNPYDMVSTNALYLKSVKANNPNYVSSFKAMMSKLPRDEFERSKFNDEAILEEVLNLFISQANAVMEITELMGVDNVLELHNDELVESPRATLTKICTFLDVDCSPQYINTCSNKVFKSVSKSRDLVVWPKRLRNEMEHMIDTCPFLHRYSFTDDQ